MPGDDDGVDSGPSCGSPPLLHPQAEAGVYCPFTATGAVRSCRRRSQACCEGAGRRGDDLDVRSDDRRVPGPRLRFDWKCNGPLDCAGSESGAVCCGAGAVQFDGTCGFYRATNVTGTHCANACLPGEIAVCGAQADCTSGTCTPFKVAGVVLGFVSRARAHRGKRGDGGRCDDGTASSSRDERVVNCAVRGDELAVQEIDRPAAVVGDAARPRRGRSPRRRRVPRPRASSPSSRRRCRRRRGTDRSPPSRSGARPGTSS